MVIASSPSSWAGCPCHEQEYELSDQLRLGPRGAVPNGDRKRAKERANRLGSASALPDGKEIPGRTGVDDWTNRHSRGGNLPHVVRLERNGGLAHNERERLSETLSVANKNGV